MEFFILISDKEVLVKFIQKPKLKHMYMKIESKDCILVKANAKLSQDYIKEFVYSKKSWLEKHLKSFSKTSISNDEFIFLGKVHKLDTFGLKADTLADFYKHQAKLFIPPLFTQYAKTMNLKPKQLSFRNNKGRWGSCSYKNNISLNINLMKAKEEEIVYVIVHELAHIKHKNHSKTFYDLVERYLPNYKLLEKGLKKIQ